MVARARETHVYLKYVHRLSYMFPPTIVERTTNRISSISTSFTLTISPPGRLELRTSIQGLNCTSSNLVYSTQCSECVLLLDIGEMKDNPSAVALKGSPATISVSSNRIPSLAKFPLLLAFQRHCALRSSWWSGFLPYPDDVLISRSTTSCELPIMYGR